MICINNVVVKINSIEENIKIIRKITDKKIIAVVKSNAYGLNSKIIIPYLKKFQIDYFAFNDIEEYLEVRELCSDCKCLILNSTRHFVDDENIRYTINNLDDAKKVISLTINVKVHLQVDTGMNRLGIRNMKEFIKIVKILNQCQKVEIEGIFTHFSSNKDENEYYERQKNKFIDYTKLVKAPIIHSAASSSILKEIVGNYLRVGLCLYGLMHEDFLKEAIYVKTSVINVFEAKKGDKIGYGQDEVPENTKIGVIPLGYYEAADFKYLLGKTTNNNKSRWERLPIFGRSCMNHRFVHINFSFKKLSYLYLFLKNDTIYIDKYRFLVSLRNIPKRYLEVKNDISKIFKTTNKKSYRLKKGRHRYQIVNSRVIW